jgi:hypothetical protein
MENFLHLWLRKARSLPLKKRGRQVRNLFRIWKMPHSRKFDPTRLNNSKVERNKQHCSKQHRNRKEWYEQPCKDQRSLNHRAQAAELNS